MFKYNLVYFYFKVQYVISFYIYLTGYKNELLWPNRLYISESKEQEGKDNVQELSNRHPWLRAVQWVTPQNLLGLWRSRWAKERLTVNITLHRLVTQKTF